MKKILVLFCMLTSLSFASTFDVKDSTTLTEKQKFEFEMEKKIPWASVGISWLLPSAGHAYAGKWGRGLGFLADEALALGLMINASNDNVSHSAGITSGSYYSGNYTYSSAYETGTDNDWMISAGLVALVGLRIWEYIDAYKTTKNYNSNLYRKLSFEPLVSVENNSVGLKASYKF